MFVFVRASVWVSTPTKHARSLGGSREEEEDIGPGRGPRKDRRRPGGRETPPSPPPLDGSVPGVLPWEFDPVKGGKDRFGNYRPVVAVEVFALDPARQVCDARLMPHLSSGPFRRLIPELAPLPDLVRDILIATKLNFPVPPIVNMFHDCFQDNIEDQIVDLSAEQGQYKKSS